MIPVEVKVKLNIDQMLGPEIWAAAGTKGRVIRHFEANKEKCYVVLLDDGRTTFARQGEISRLQ